jgi:4-amino-4-deoxy-L-arabinose transferase-like glycosyltransferase
MRSFLLRKSSTLLLVTGLALVLRLAGLVSRPIWYDEAFSLLLARVIPSSLAAAAADVHPPAYYLGLWTWMQFFGDGLASARLFSVLAGAATAGLVCLFALELFENRGAALLAGLGVACAPFLVHYGQEIRMYSLLALALTGATYAFWKALRGRGGWWLVFALLAALAQYTHNLAAFYLLPLSLTPFWMRRWKDVLSSLAAGTGALLLYLPWLVYSLAQLEQIRRAYWVERPGGEKIFTTLLSFVTNLPLEPGQLAWGLSLAALTLALAVYQTILAVRKKTRQAGRGLWLAYLALTPPLLLFAVSQWIPIYIERGLVASAVLFWLWLAWAFGELSFPGLLRGLAWGALAAACGLGLYNHLAYAGFPYAPYAPLAADLIRETQPGDLVLHSSKLTALPLAYFAPGVPQAFLQDPSGSSTDTLAESTRLALQVDALSGPEHARAAGKIWFVIFDKSIQEAREAGLPAHPHLAWLDANYTRSGLQAWGPVWIYIYRR